MKKENKNKSLPIQWKQGSKNYVLPTKKMPQINGRCNECTYPSKYGHSNLHNCNISHIDTSGGGVLYKDVVLKHKPRQPIELAKRWLNRRKSGVHNTICKRATMWACAISANTLGSMHNNN